MKDDPPRSPHDHGPWMGRRRECEFCGMTVPIGEFGEKTHACNQMLAHKLDSIFTFLVAKFPEVASRIGGDR